MTTTQRRSLLLVPTLALALALCSCGGGGEGASGAPVVLLPPVTPPAALGLVSGSSSFTAGCSLVNSTGTLYINSEVEPHIAINPTNADNLVASWQQDRWSDGAARGVTIAHSQDGGATWSRAALPASRCGGGNVANGGDYERATDPWVTFSPNGVAYQMSLAVSGASFQPGALSAMLVFRSIDGGRSWGAPTTLVRDGPQFFNDKNTITADPNDARFVYAVWNRLTNDNRGPALFTRSTDGGATWEPVKAIFDPGAGNQTIGNVIAVLPAGGGGVLVNVFTRLVSAGGQTRATVMALRSSDKGGSWSLPITIGELQSVGTRDPDTGTAVRDGSILPQVSVSPQGALNVVWQDASFSSGARDGIAFARSTDGGLTWSAPSRVNASPAVAAMVPTPHVRADGTIGVSYFDFRSNTADPATLLTDYWLATSRDGISWSERRIAEPFNLATAPVARALFLGDYMGLVSRGTTFLPLYVRTTGDINNRNDVFLTPINVPPTTSLALAATPATAKETVRADWAARVHDNIVRRMEHRVPGWAARRGLKENR